MQLKIKETAKRLMDRRLLQIEEIGVLRTVLTNRIKKMEDEKDISKTKILISSLDKNETEALAEIEEYKEIINN